MRSNHSNSKKSQAEPANQSNILATYKRLLKYASRYWFYLILGILGTSLSSAVDAGLTWSLKPLLDEGFIAHNQRFINLLPLFVMLAFLVRSVTAFMSTYFISLVSRNVVMELRQQMFSHMLRLPASYYDSNTAGQLISKIIYNIEQVAQASANTLIIIVRESFFIAGLIAVMFINSWRLTLLFFITAPFIAIVARYSSRRTRKYSRRVQTGMGDITQSVEEAIEGYRVIRIFGGEKYEYHKFEKATKVNREREMQMIKTNAFASPASQLVIAIIIAITIYLATTAVGNITAGAFASIIAAMLAILKPLRNITTVNNSIQKGIVAAESVFEFLDYPLEKDTGKIHLNRVKGAINFENVEFDYGSGKKVLHDINFDIQPGQAIALIGKSGSGKSTLLSLLPRFYDHYSGIIRIDGIDIRTIKLHNLRQQFSIVSQSITLFNDTVARNIAYGSSNVSHADIVRVAIAANAMDFIKLLPQGLNTVIGDNGVLLSGGQRQRIAIARALLKDAPILILDEATSSLDSESESHIYLALQHLMRNRTTLIIAHRLSTIENADKILVLQEGAIIENGTHHELIKYGQEYAKLHALQFKEHLKEIAETETSETKIPIEEEDFA